MGPSPWAAAWLGATFAMWVVMMTVMMLPATTSVTRVVLQTARAQPGENAAATGSSFAIGYMSVWAAFSAAATLLQAWLTSSMALDDSMTLVARWAQVAVIALAIAWQLSPWKSACLSRCRAPLAFALHEWRPGFAGGMRMGAKHGFACVGCCWAMMLVLFAVGVMNYAAIGLLAFVIWVERTRGRQQQVTDASVNSG